MSDLPAILPDTLPFGDRKIRFIRLQPILDSNLVAALVVIEPSTTNISPDIVVGFGRVDFEAKADAFTTAKKQIKGNAPSHPG
ncbi:MAG: hypothetical protein KJ070_18340 [Verrucomicrobia bacterium]|nr:hypothetical protein [Verrucomicrobiota bacterium]